jgi:hypothetical protein
MHKRCRKTGNGCGERAVHRLARDDLAFGVEEHAGVCGKWCAFARIHEEVAIIYRPVEKIKAPAPDPGGVGFDDREGSRHGDGRIECITARLDDFLTCRGGQGMGRGDRGFAGFLKRLRRRARITGASSPRCRAWKRASNWSCVSGCAGSFGMQSTGQTCTHWGVSK